MYCYELNKHVLDSYVFCSKAHITDFRSLYCSNRECKLAPETKSRQNLDLINPQTYIFTLFLFDLHHCMAQIKKGSQIMIYSTCLRRYYPVTCRRLPGHLRVSTIFDSYSHKIKFVQAAAVKRFGDKLTLFVRLFNDIKKSKTV